MNRTLVIYHDKCVDGFASAWAFHMLHKNYPDYGNKTTYKAMNYGEPVTEHLKNTDVYILDFSFPREIIKAMCDIAKSVTVIDHHKEAVESLLDFAFSKQCPKNFTLKASTAVSGCYLTWENFAAGEAMPRGIKLVSDRDTWQFRDKDSKAFHAFITTLPLDFFDWTTHMYYPEIDAIPNGRLLLKKEMELVKQTASGAMRSFIRYDENDSNSVVECMVCNCLMSLASETGHYLIENNKGITTAVLYQVIDNKFKFSIRTNDDMDANRIAKVYKGGGHPKAAGFVLPKIRGLTLLNSLLNKHK